MEAAIAGPGRRGRAGMCAIAMAVGLLASAGAGAQSAPIPGLRVSDARLDSLRGGVNVNQVLMSIGITRSIFVNGEPVVTTILNLPLLTASGNLRTAAANQVVTMNAASQTPADASAPAAAPPSPAPAPAPVAATNGGTSPVVITGDGGMHIVQNGAGNSVSLQNLPSAAGTIIQNTLDNQSIRTVTTIDARVLTQGVMQGLNLSASMNEAFRRPVSR